MNEQEAKDLIDKYLESIKKIFGKDILDLPIQEQIDRVLNFYYYLKQIEDNRKNLQKLLYPNIHF